MTTTSSDKRAKVAVIAGAGPAALTAALELPRRSGISTMFFRSGWPRGRNFLHAAHSRNDRPSGAQSDSRARGAKVSANG
jgi:thioredoxin reductase